MLEIPLMKPELLQRTTIKPDKCGGRPASGKRMRALDILRKSLSAGASVEEILADDLFLESDDILPALEYARSADGPRCPSIRLSPARDGTR